MKAIVFSIVIIFASLAYIAEISISIKPFKISFERPCLAIGLLFLIIGIWFIHYQSFSDGKKAGLNFSREFIKEIIQEEER